MQPTWATPENSKVGDKVLVPIDGEYLHQDQICTEYEVVLMLKCKVHPKDQVIGKAQDPLPEYLPFTGEEGFKI